MKMRTAIAAVAFGAVVAGASPAQAADIPAPPEVPATPGAWIHGIGNFTYHEPGTEGHRIRFGIYARMAADGTAHGVFAYRHQLPDGQVIGAGIADVTCVHVEKGVALVAAVVPEGQGNVANHGFYVRIVEGRHGRPDQITTVQASGGTERPPSYCVDPEPIPGLRPYPVERGGYTFGS